KKVRVGMEASGHARWFERLLTEGQFELWIGDAAEIRTKRVRKQKTDRQDAELLLRLLIEDRFPRIWVADGENRDLRQLLWHRHRMVQMRTRIMNQLHVLALNEGVRRKKALWRPAGRAQLQSLVLARWASRRRQDLLELLDQLTPKGRHKFIKKRVMRRTGVRPEYAGAAWACPRWRRIDTNSTKSTTLTEVREENMMRQRARILALFLLVTIGAASQYAQAANVSVNCDKHDSIRKTLHLVAISNSKGPSTITVSGACEENVVIQGMDRLTLI